MVGQRLCALNTQPTHIDPSGQIIAVYGAPGHCTLLRVGCLWRGFSLSMVRLIETQAVKLRDDFHIDRE